MTFLRTRAWQGFRLAPTESAIESAGMVETSITAGRVQAPASERPLIEYFLALLSRRFAVWQARRLATVDRIRHTGLKHID